MGVTLPNKHILEETSDTSPALASFEGRLFIAWKGSGNDNLNVAFSSDNGATFSGKHTSSETSDSAPALAVLDGQQLCIAWKGSGNDNLNVATVDFVADMAGHFSIAGLSHKHILEETSDTSPALASTFARGRLGELIIAWKGSGNDNLNVASSSDIGATFSGNPTVSDTSDSAPALAVLPVPPTSLLFIAWKGSGNDNLNVATVDFADDTAGGHLRTMGLSHKVILSETSDHGPALAVLNEQQLCIAWKGSGNDNLNVASSSVAFDGPLIDHIGSFSGNPTVSDTSDVGPALAVHNGQFFIAWKGSGNDNLNVATVNFGF